MMRRLSLGALAAALVFGMAAVGCGNGIDPALNGRWTYYSDDETPIESFFIFNDGNWMSNFLGLDFKGTYTAGGNAITLTPTHMHENGFTGTNNWYTRSEIRAPLIAAQGEMPTEATDWWLNALFTPLAATYSIVDSSLNLTFTSRDGVTTVAITATRQP